MKQKIIINITKWIVISILATFNFLAYMVNGTSINLIMTIAVLLYSIYEFFNELAGRNLRPGMKIYLLMFYFFAALSLFLGLKGFLIGNSKALLLGLIFLIGDTTLILYTLHKLSSENNQNQRGDL